VNEKRIRSAVSLRRKIAVGNFTPITEDLHIGQLNGNRFRVFLRHIKNTEREIENAIEKISKNGFINYYGNISFDLFEQK